jgi:hypothetical protein
MIRLSIFAVFALTLNAQEPVAPTPDRVGNPVRGEDHGSYNVVQSWELGYRFSEVGGNEGEYRSDVNYGNGIRLLGSSLTVNSKNGHGHYFDEIVLTTQGLGNDPYESANLRVQKNKIYRYDMTWRQSDYFNPGLVVADGTHFLNTKYRWQDHDLTIFPQGKYRLSLGYSRTVQDGPALSSQQFFGSTGDVVPLFSNVRQEFNSYKIGGEIEFHRWHLNVLRRWEFYKEDTSFAANGITAGMTSITSFNKAQPYHGSTPGWLVNLLTARRWVAFNGRFTYANGNRNFIQNELALGMDRFGANQNRQVVVAGNASRPVVTGDASVTLFLTSKLTIVNNSSISSMQISGSNFFEQVDFATLSAQTLTFQYLGIRLFKNETDARYQFSRKFSAYAGYNYSNRLINSTLGATDPQTPFDLFTFKQTNTLHAAVAGFNWNPIAPLRVHVEGELGRNDNPFTIVSEKNYHAVSAKVQYRLKSVQLSADYRENYNNNSITLSSYSSHARNYSANASWAPRAWVSVDASYSRLHLDTLGGLAFFAGAPRAQLQTGLYSVYVSNIHAGTLMARFAIAKRADLFVGYTINRDVGGSVPPAGVLPVPALLSSVQTFPLTFQSPSARISVRLHEKVRLNFGYQYYGYKEEFGLFGINDNYRANTGFTSVLWTF